MTTQALRCRLSICLLIVASCFWARGIESASAEAARPARAAVFRAAGFPTVDAQPIDDATLASALAGLTSETLDSPAALASRLKRAEHDVLLLTYGSAFPAEAWPAIRDFVREGGGLVVLGGAPFHQPVRRSGDAYVLGSRQPTYARELLIGPAQEIDVTAFAAPRTSVVVAGSGWTQRRSPSRDARGRSPSDSTSVKDMPGEDGSAGPARRRRAAVGAGAGRPRPGARLSAAGDRSAPWSRRGWAVGVRANRCRAPRRGDPRGGHARTAGFGRDLRSPDPRRRRAGRTRRGFA